LGLKLGRDAEVVALAASTAARNFEAGQVATRVLDWQEKSHWQVALFGRNSPASVSRVSFRLFRLFRLFRFFWGFFIY
jgi:hypothetical protein